MAIERLQLLHSGEVVYRGGGTVDCEPSVGEAHAWEIHVRLLSCRHSREPVGSLRAKGVRPNPGRTGSCGERRLGAFAGNGPGEQVLEDRQDGV